MGRRRGGKRFALGECPDGFLKAPAGAGDKARELLAQGLDPGEKRKADKAEAERREQEQARTFQAVLWNITSGNGWTSATCTGSRLLPGLRIRYFPVSAIFP